MVDTQVFVAASEAEDNQTAAHYYADQGIPVLPLEPGTKRPARILGPEGGHKLATTDHEDIEGWWGENGNLGVGYKPGPAGLVLIDIDGVDGRRDYEELGFDWDNPGTVTIATPGRNGGRHVLHRGNDDQLALLEGPKKMGRRGAMEAIADGKYACAPPTIHPDGGNYIPLVVPDIILPLPATLADQLTGKTFDTVYYGPPEENVACGWCASGIRGCLREIRGSTAGERNDVLFGRLSRIVEFPHPGPDTHWVHWIGEAKKAYLSTHTPAEQREAEKEWKGTLASVNMRQDPKGGYGTGNCDNREETAKHHMRVGKTDLSTRPQAKRLLPATKIAPTATEFLYKDLVPLGCYVNLVGDSNVGKSSFARYLITELVSGTLQNGTRTPTRGSALYVTSEEVPSRDIVPLVRASLEAKHGTEDVDEYLYNLVCEDVTVGGSELAIDDGGESLEAYLMEMSNIPDMLPPKLVVLDSFDHYLKDAEANPNSMKKIKEALGDVNEVAARWKVTVLIIDHTSKVKRDLVMNDVAGSGAKNTEARASLRFAYHPDRKTADGALDDQRVLVLTKGSFVSPDATQAEIFEFVPTNIVLPNSDGEVTTTVRAYLKYVVSSKSINRSNFEDRTR